MESIFKCRNIIHRKILYVQNKIFEQNKKCVLCSAQTLLEALEKKKTFFSNKSKIMSSTLCCADTILAM